MSNLLLAKNFTAGGAIAAYRLVTLSAAETVAQAAANGAAAIGVNAELPVVAGERCDVVTQGIAYVEAGAAVALGALVMSDAQGRGITAAAAAGTNIRHIGIALDAAAAAGDIIRVLLSPGSFQG